MSPRCERCGPTTWVREGRCPRCGDSIDPPQDASARATEPAPAVDKRHGFTGSRVTSGTYALKVGGDELSQAQCAAANQQAAAMSTLAGLREQVMARSQLGTQQSGIAMQVAREQQMQAARAVMANYWGRGLQRVDEPPLTAERLARALWETDPDVHVFISEVADASVCRDGQWAVRYGARDRAADIAWERDELGLKSKWTERAEKVLAELGRRK